MNRVTRAENKSFAVELLILGGFFKNVPYSPNTREPLLEPPVAMTGSRPTTAPAFQNARP